MVIRDRDAVHCDSGDSRCLKAMPAAWQGTTVQHLVSMGQVLPGFAEGLGWVVPAIVGFIVGFVLSRSVGSSHTSN